MLPAVYFDRLKENKEGGKKEKWTKKKNDGEKGERKVVVCKPINFYPSVCCILPSAALQEPHTHTHTHTGA